MKWTKRKPTKPGWYWCHRVGMELPYITALFQSQKRIIDYAGRSPSNIFYRLAKWAGPIPEPEATK
jgi:hypothetical protein